MTFMTIEGKPSNPETCEICGKPIEKGDHFDVQVGADRVPHYQHTACRRSAKEA